MKQFTSLFYKLRKNFLNYSTPVCVGIDIGSASIKMIELEYNSLKIAKYSIAPINKNLVSEGVINEIEQVAIIIRRQWAALNSKYSHVAIAIPYNSIIIKDLTVPKFKAKHDLDAYVLKQLIDELDTKDIDFDYTVVRQVNDNQQLSVVVAKKEKIEEYQAVIQITGMKVAAIDVEPFAIQYLFGKLLKREQINSLVILLDVGITRIRAYFFQNMQPVYFNEISVDYYNFIEDIILQYAKDIILRDIGDICKFMIGLINSKNIIPTKWIDMIVTDVNKLLQMAKSNILVEKKISLADNPDIYLMGGNAIIPGLIDRLSVTQMSAIYLADKLLMKQNNKIPHEDLIRLIPAIALATWGQ